ncbi:protein-glutamate methylesterase/protein-glutamine glutaminase [Gallaecimonas xiamenensis]|uniref:Protein-glutamate methylesterase/protein-glutamine glutaminase n=1 Tax=Gallaecimonas xiamenensis 3-C-1 TaxID=745411 RepID=K2JYI8_9GAMM|nr:chemotaxis response regulator protein-glutamate methylesterase [Gallaecimonas xiamenensis]EKE75399.1 chemotaxis-specific protein-glutamate methyltransferase [Gallaecimonas xiamenensis 3-C-1]
MPIRVLVVDDSSFFRRRVSEILESDAGVQVIDTAINGKDAVQKAKDLRPDVITMDIEMPVMDGISAVREIMLANPTPILMFSSLTHDGAKATLDALDAGALDFLPKRFEDIAKDRNDAVATLLTRVKTLANRRGLSLIKARQLRSASTPTIAKPEPAPAPLRSEHSRESAAPPPRRRRSTPYKLLAIGCSTGGPVALQQILTRLPGNFPLPIILIQHMPGTFTSAFAQRLNGLCQITVKEAENGDRLQAGTAYLAPGGKQMLVEGAASAMRLKVTEGPESLVYKPSVDITFASAAKVTGDVLSVILTGMGADGRDGSRLLKAQGATLFAQDEASCVVYGMPQAVTAAGLTDESISLERIAGRILAEIGHG